MRSSIASVPCSFSNQPDATAIVYYLHDALSHPVNTTAWPAWTASLSGQCGNVGGFVSRHCSLLISS